MTTGHLTLAAAPTASRWSASRVTWIALVAILLVAIVPRVAGLGEAPIWIDEDLTWLATHGVLETGFPYMPSGALYARAPLYTYITAASLWIGDGATIAMRLPSVVSSIALIFVVFLFGRALGGRAVGITAALVLAFSPWDVHYARMARMYELFAFLYLLTVYLAYLGLMRGNRGARVGMLVTAALAVATHQQAATLAAVFLAPILFPRPARPPIGWMLAGVVVTAIAFKVTGAFADFGFAESAGLDVIGRREETGAISVPFLGLVDLNHARFLLFEAFGRNALIGGVAIAAVLGAGVWNVVRLLRDGKVLAAAAGVVFAGALMTNQLFIAAVLALFIVKLAESTVSGGIRRGLDLGIAGGAAILITLGAVALTLGTEALSDRMVLRSFFALPVPWYKRLFQTYPFMFSIVVTGIGVYYLRALRPASDHRMMFLIAAFVIPLIGQGVIYSPYFGYRYNFYLSPLMLLIFAMSIVPVVSFLTTAMTPQLRRVAVAVTMVGVLLVLFCDAFDPVEAFGISGRQFGYNRDRFDHPDVTASYNYDFPNTAAYVTKYRSPGDVIIVRDPVNLYPYLGASDYIVSAPYDGRSKDTDGNFVDFYTGIPYLGSAAELSRVLNEHAGVNRWIIYTMSSGPSGPHTKLTDDQLDYLTLLRDFRVFTGEDETTVVVKIPAGTTVRPPSPISGIGRVADQRPESQD